jgi:hypothetical protein
VNVGFVGPDSASARVRIGQFSAALRGSDLRTLTWWPKRRSDVARLFVQSLALARWSDVLVLVKPRQPRRVIDALRRANPNIVVDIDDAIWEWNASTATRFTHALERARLAIAGSDYLVSEITTMRATIPTVRMRPAIDVSAYAPRDHHSRAPVIIGWIGGPSSLNDFTPQVVAALQRVVGHRAELVVVCDRPLEADVQSRFVPWTLEAEASLVGGFDIGIMPLRDDPASRGRCGLKVIQYQAAGLPVVASPVGVGPELVDSEVGMLAAATDDWIGGLSVLVADASLRRRLGEAARVRAEERYDLGVSTDIVQKAFASLASTKVSSS